MEINNILIIGAGRMGAGIAQAAIESGYSVKLYDVDSNTVSKSMEGISRRLDRQVEKDKISQEDKSDCLKRLESCEELIGARDVDLVIEAASEDIRIKKEVFKMLDGICRDDTILATNTSSMSITEIASFTTRPEKVVGMHFFNPVSSMKLVEIIEGVSTSGETLEKACGFAERMDKITVIAKDKPGFVVNRILVPMINEAIFVLDEGIAGMESIDSAMIYGSGQPMGPLRLADMIGLDVLLSVMEVLHMELGEDKYRPSPLLRKMVKAGHLGKKTGRGFYEYK